MYVISSLIIYLVDMSSIPVSFLEMCHSACRFESHGHHNVKECKPIHLTTQQMDISWVPAKLMEENPMLLRLKEMEYVERIADKVNSISLAGGGQVLDQLREIFVRKS